MTRHWGSGGDSTLRLARVIERTEVLGPGPRAVVVVQGCHLRCRGCVAEPTHALDGGFGEDIGALAARLGALDDIAGVTFSGGEPFLQAAALSRLVDLLREQRPTLSTMSFSGYRLEWLRAKGSPAQRALLDRLDLLVDGPYVERLHAPLRWRGSSNQRLHALSARHEAELAPEHDAPAGMEWSIDADLVFEWVGVPPVPGLVDRLVGDRPESIPDNTHQEVIGS
ncbi:MAG TPA: 4Fe-4S single cluster domain-containing protein [Solirubrobacterales bacterium]|nr:4Fe-4S single cluster domain-containing protein [Solirubrobacterales bacterium]